MTPPDANIRKQTRRHRPVLIGFGLVAVFVAILLLWFLAQATDGERGETPEVVAPATATEEAAEE